MSAKILERKELIPGQTTQLVLDAPQIARAAEPGNFVILRVHERGERIPLTIADTDPEAGTITLVYLVLGASTYLLDQQAQGEMLLDVCGPLGKPTHIQKHDGPVVCVGGGTGIAAMHHIAKGFAAAGNKVVSVIGARSQDLLLFQDELAKFSDEVLIATDDGSVGTKGFVTNVLEKYMDEHPDVAEVVAIGPVPMMNAVARLTEPRKVPTVVSLNAIMIDGMGMCGACRVTVGGKVEFACVDGPEFDGHQVDFQELSDRLRAFKEEEKCSFEQCRLGGYHG